LELKEDDRNSFWKQARVLGLEEKLKSYGKNLALQGELVGEGIQGNKLKIRGQNIFFFNAFDIDGFYYFNHFDFKNLIQTLDLVTVPVLDEDYALENDMEKLIEKASIKSIINTGIWAEGIVIRPVEEAMDLFMSSTGFNNSGRLSFKVINPEFLLKYE